MFASMSCQTDLEARITKRMVSHLHYASTKDSLPELILPPAMIISPIIWDIDDQISQENLRHPALPGGPEFALHFSHFICVHTVLLKSI